MCIRIGHGIIFGTLELVCLNDTRWFVVDRQREELRSIEVPGQKFLLTQRLSGRRFNGELEVLERYESEDGSESFVLDASPVWLEELKTADGMFHGVSTK